jgi:hypothetical protein
MCVKDHGLHSQKNQSDNFICMCSWLALGWLGSSLVEIKKIKAQTYGSSQVKTDVRMHPPFACTYFQTRTLFTCTAIKATILGTLCTIFLFSDSNIRQFCHRHLWFCLGYILFNMLFCVTAVLS